MTAMETPDILIVDDDENLNFALKQTLTRRDFQVDQAHSFLEAKEKIGRQSYPMIISDVRMPDGNGIELVAEIKRRSPQTAVIIITAYGKIEDAITALKNGAEDYLIKPFPADSIVKLAEKYFPEHFNRAGASEFLTREKSLEELLQKAQRAARSQAAILIVGESGTGKEVLARFIHAHSPRNRRPYLALNCAAIPENLLESELFGYEKGAFTGADKFKPGKFELADKGTLVLDEIGDMPLHLQAKLLRVLQEKEIDRLGGRRSVPVDVRILSLSNQDIQEKIRLKTFREDLLYRLNVVEFDIPPLRDRPEDIRFLASHFARQFASEIDRKEIGFSDPALERLLNHSWPGNVRELQNTIHRAVIFCTGQTIEASDIGFRASPPGPPAPGSEATTLADMEREMILLTLSRTGNNKNRASEILGISARTLRNKLKEYGIGPPH
jgi:DNA-binding NtrC family response regulator